MEWIAENFLSYPFYLTKIDFIDSMYIRNTNERKYAKKSIYQSS